MKVQVLLVAVMMAVFLAFSEASGAEEMSDEQLYAEWEAYMDEVLPEWDAHREYWRESLGWQAAPCLRGLVSGYRYSKDEKWLFATAFEPYQELFQGVIVCLHADFRIGGLNPGETKKIRGKIYLMENDVSKLLTRYRRDFPEHVRAPGSRPPSSR